MMSICRRGFLFAGFLVRMEDNAVPKVVILRGHLADGIGRRAFTAWYGGDRDGIVHGDPASKAGDPLRAFTMPLRTRNNPRS